MQNILTILKGIDVLIRLSVCGKSLHIMIVDILFVVAILVCGSNSTEMVVPNIVHHTYDYQHPSYFLYLSIMTAQFYLKPTKHFIWVNDEGRFRRGHWESWQANAAKGSWQSEFAALLESGKIVAKLMTYPTHPPGNETTYVNEKAHRSDFLRFIVLKEHGGIYLDTDAFPTHSFDSLREHEFTMAFDNVVNSNKKAINALRLNNGVMLSAPNSQFLQLWEKAYYNFDPSSFDYHSSVVPFHLATEYPDLIHVEMNRLAPMSYGLQTSEAAAALTCGLYLPTTKAIWYPTFSTSENKYIFPNSPDPKLYNAFEHKLVFHLTMSQVRGVAMLRKYLGGPQDLEKMPSYLGALWRRAIGNGIDKFDHDGIERLFSEKNTVKALETWTECRNILGMNTPVTESNFLRNQPHDRQQYVTRNLPFK